MEEMIFNLADTHLFFNDLEVSSVILYKLHVVCLKIDDWSYNKGDSIFEYIIGIMRQSNCRLYSNAFCLHGICYALTWSVVFQN